jgi:hypothetical protein
MEGINDVYGGQSMSMLKEEDNMVNLGAIVPMR